MDKIGITENGDISFNLEAFDNLKEANIIITKRLTKKLIDKLVEHKDKCIFHFTVTGMGGSVLEKFVPSLYESSLKFGELIDKGFPIEQTVLRIDPIIPTPKGVQTAIEVLRVFSIYKIPRVRWSSMDMYNHVKERFYNNGIKLPYETFHAPRHLINGLYTILESIAHVNEFKLEACGEPNFEPTPCISQRDLDILGVNIELIGNKNQRGHCGCPSNKSELIKQKPSQCDNSCTYCFWGK